VPSLNDVRQELEWKLCAQSPLYFFENYWSIPVVGVGLSDFQLRDFQRETIETLAESDLVVILKARQIGMSTIILAYTFWWAFFHEEVPWLLISRNEKAAIKLLQRATRAFFRLPAWMRLRGPDLVSNTQTLLEFANGSRIESVPATGDTGRGDSVFGVVMDECAFMEYASSIYAAVEPLVYGKLVLMSTANGMGNLFHETWLSSQKEDSKWVSLFYPWNTVPSRDDAWYRNKRLSFLGQEWMFFQEYPATPAEAFAKSGRVAFSEDVLQYNNFMSPSKVLSWGFDGRFYEESFSDVKLQVWQDPFVWRDEFNVVVQKPNYVIGVDVAEGLERGDWTVVKVFDVNTLEEVAVSRSHILVEDLGSLVEAIGYMYHTALVVIERNNHGLVPIVYLQDAHYPRLYRYVPSGRRRAGRREEYGWVTSSRTKPKMVVDFLRALRDQSVLLHDREFMVEAQTFVSDGKGGYASSEQNHDDDVMATLICWQGVLEQNRFPVVFHDYATPPLTMDDFLNYDKGETFRGLDQPIGGPKMVAARRGLFIRPENVVSSDRK